MANFGGGLFHVGCVGGAGQAADADAVPVDESGELVPYRVPLAPDTNGLHHTGIPQLLAHQIPVEHSRLFDFVWFYTSDEKRLTLLLVFFTVLLYN